MNKRFLLAILAVLALVLGACSSSDDDGGDGESDASSEDAGDDGAEDDTAADEPFDDHGADDDWGESDLEGPPAALDDDGHHDVAIMAYAAKYASARLVGLIGLRMNPHHTHLVENRQPSAFREGLPISQRAPGPLRIDRLAAIAKSRCSTFAAG